MEAAKSSEYSNYVGISEFDSAVVVMSCENVKHSASSVSFRTDYEIEFVSSGVSVARAMANESVKCRKCFAVCLCYRFQSVSNTRWFINSEESYRGSIPTKLSIREYRFSM